MRAKWKRECMAELLLDDNTLTNEAKILNELTIFYTKLFSANKDLYNNQEGAINQLLQSTSQVLSDKEIHTLEK